MTYRVRKANVDDVEVLLELSRRVTNFNNRQFMEDGRVDAFMASPFFIEEITENIEDMQVVLENKKICGLITWKENVLMSLMVDPDYQGKGAAQFLLTETMKERLLSFDLLTLECFEDNKGANKFYQKMGWVLEGTKEDCDSDMNTNIYTYERG